MQEAVWGARAFELKGDEAEVRLRGPVFLDQERAEVQDSREGQQVLVLAKETASDVVGEETDGVSAGCRGSGKSRQAEQKEQVADRIG